jgi:hypothetical protein
MPSVQVEFNTEYQNAHRFPAWMALSVFSIVCLAAIGAESTRDERDAAIKWSLAVASMSMIVSFLAVVAYLMARGVFVGQTPETALVRMLREVRRTYSGRVSSCAGMPAAIV